MCSQSQGDGGTEGWEDGGMGGWRDGRMEGWDDGGTQLSLAMQSPEVLRYSPSMRSRLQGYPHPAEEDEEKPSSHPTPRETLWGSPTAGPGPDTATPRGRGARGTHMGYPRCPRVHPCFCSRCARPGLCTWGLPQGCARLRFLVHARACARMHGRVRAPVPCTLAHTSPSVRVAEEAAAAPGELLPAALLLLQLRGRVLPKAPPPPKRCRCGEPGTIISAN